jgi:hypothetical protein
MPIQCGQGGEARYRYKRGTKIRLAFCGNQVREVTNMKTGTSHRVRPKPRRS